MTLLARRDPAFLTAGWLATSAQVLLLRELMVDAAGDEASIGIGLAAWFAGIAIGARLVRTAAAPDPAPPEEPPAAETKVAASLALLAIAPPLALVAGRVLRRALSPDAGELPGASLTLLLALATIAPAGVLVGRLFTVMAAAWARGASAAPAVARLYVVESAGSMLGGLLVTLLAVAQVLPVLQAALFGGVGAALALVAIPVGRRSLAPAAGACLLLALVSPAVESWSEDVRFAGMAGGVHRRATAHTPYQHLATGGDEVLHLYASGQYASSFPDPYAAESLGHLLALLAERPAHVLLLGGIERGLLPVLLRHRGSVERITVVVADRAALAFLEPQLPAAEREALADPRVRLVFDDPRRVLARGRERYGLVLHLGADPVSLLRARLFSVEFLRLVAARLRPDGVLVVSLPSAPTVLAGETEQLAGVLVRTLREALPVVHATLANEAFAVAGFQQSAVTLDPVVLAARWGRRGVLSPSFDAAVLPVLLPPGRVSAQEEALFAAASRAPLGRDDRPVSLVHALARRQQLVPDRTGRLIRIALGVPPPLLVALALLPASWLALRLLRRPEPARAVRLAAAHAVAVTGAAGLGWSLVLLFSFQTHAGALYGWLGALVAVFMLGLAAGGALGPRLRSGGLSLPLDLRAAGLWLAGAGAFALALPLALALAAAAARVGFAAVLALHAALLLGAGLATGGVFPLAVRLRLSAGEPPGRAAARVEAWDHVGAAASALCGAVLFLPVLGLRASTALLAALLLLALAALAWCARLQGRVRID